MNPDNPIDSLREQVFNLLIHDPQAHESARQAYVGAKAASDSLLPRMRASERFSDFIPEHVEAARELAESYAELVADSAALDDAETPGLSGCQAVVEAHRRGLATDLNPDLLDYALMLFMAHSPDGRRYLHGTVPPLLARQLHELAGPTAEAATQFEFYGKSIPTNEDGLEWFRADPLSCEHHFHWHVVYPFRGRIKNRQGELFIYMHTQMLARYDAERLAAKLEPVEPYHDYEQALPVSHNPGSFVVAHEFEPRAPEAQPRDVNRYGRIVRVDGMQGAKQAFDDAIERNRFSTEAPINADSLGDTLEANSKAVGQPKPYYNYHNNGHVMLAWIHDGDDPGVMISTATATRDPIFWMWHKHIDRQSELWQDRQPANDFSDAPKQVEIGKPRVIATNLLTDVEDLERFAEVSTAADAPSRLRTRMRSATLEYEHQSVDYEHLEHDPFSYVLPVHNKGTERRKLTLRVWLAPEDRAEQRRAWIEMDKFVVELGAGERRWIRRADIHAAVIRKPAVVNPGEYNRDYRPASTMPVLARDIDDTIKKLEEILDANKRAHRYLERADKDTPELRVLRDRASAAVARGDIQPAQQALNAYYRELLPPSQARAFCECGWPYHLLVPRGNPEGMRFVLMVMATDWELDKVSNEPCCGSMSFCGAADDYPDKREMGYPFNRGFPGGLMQTLQALEQERRNVGLSQLVITFEPSSTAER